MNAQQLGNIMTVLKGPNAARIVVVMLLAACSAIALAVVWWKSWNGKYARAHPAQFAAVVLNPTKETPHFVYHKTTSPLAYHVKA